MKEQSSMSGGLNPAVAGGPSAGEQSGSGASNGANGIAANAMAGQPGGGTATGNLTGGESNSPNGGLAKVFAGQPEAGAERATGSAVGQMSANAQAGQPGQTEQPKGNQGQEQSNDSLTLPAWAAQLHKKMKSDPATAAKLSTFKNLDEFVQAYLDVSAQDGNALPVPGKDSSPEEVQMFYERLGKPKEASLYSFAKNNPDFARAAFDANLSNGQADALLKASLAQLDDARAGIQATLAQDFQATDVLLQKEFGDNYGEAIALMQRGLGNNLQTGALSPIGQALVNAGLAGKPEIVRAFIELGRATSEGTAAGGSAGTSRPQSVMEGRGFDYKDTYN